MMYSGKNNKILLDLEKVLIDNNEIETGNGFDKIVHSKEITINYVNSTWNLCIM